MKKTKLKALILVLCIMCGSSMLFAQKDVILRTKSHIKPSKSMQESLQISECYEINAGRGFYKCSSLNVDYSINTFNSAKKSGLLPDIKFLHTNDTLRYTGDAYPLPDDPYFSEQWALNNSTHYTSHWGKAHQIATGEGITIAVIDLGIDWKHPDLFQNIYQNLREDSDGDGTVLEIIDGIVYHDPDDIDGIDNDGNGYIDDFTGWDIFYDDNQTHGYDSPAGYGTHGTSSASVIAASKNDYAIVGVAPDAKIIPLKIFGSYTTEEHIINAFAYAIDNGSQIINNSWGGGTFKQGIQDIIIEAIDSSIVVVCSAGNDGYNTDPYPYYPAGYVDEIISVGAIDINGQKASWSNYGEHSVDIMSPGVGLWSLAPSNYPDIFTEPVRLYNGTSAAAPVVSGAVAMYLELYPNATIADIKNSLITSAIQTTDLEGLSIANGYLNFYDFLVAGSHCDSINVTLSGYLSGGQTYEGFTISTDSTTILDGVDLEGQLIEIRSGTEVKNSAIEIGNCREN